MNTPLTYRHKEVVQCLSALPDKVGSVKARPVNSASDISGKASTLQKRVVYRGFLSDQLMSTQGGGLFCNPSSKEAPAKLRLLYEAAPIAFIMEAAGGASHDGKGSVLDRRIQAAQDRSIISLGTKVEVEKSIAALQWQ